MTYTLSVLYYLNLPLKQSFFHGKYPNSETDIEPCLIRLSECSVEVQSTKFKQSVLVPNCTAILRSPSMKNVREANRGLNTIYNISLSENIYRYIDMNNSSSRYIYIVILTFILLSRYLHRYIYFVYLYLYICNSYNDIVISIYWYGYFDIWHRDLDIFISLSRYLFCLSGKIYLRQM